MAQESLEPKNPAKLEIGKECQQAASVQPGRSSGGIIHKAGDIAAPGNYLGFLGSLELRCGLGLLRLSTEGRPTELDAIAVIHYALDRGIRLLDTADVYCLGDEDLHYGERLARKAVDTWNGPREEVRIVTKVGLARPKGRWVPNGRPEHLRKAVDGSLQALGLERLFAVLLHANDPRTPFEDQLGTLAELQRIGKIAHLGLCNVSIAEVRQAQRHFNICAIQNELSVIDRKSATEGVVALAAELKVPFLAFRVLGGHAKVDTILKNRAVAPIASRHKVTPHEAALAVVWEAGSHVVPLIGATRIERIDSCLRARELRLDHVDRATLAAKISLVPTSEATAELVPPVTPSGIRQLSSGDGPGDEPEVVLLMGIQGAGKSDFVRQYVEKGYVRLNRDQEGGGLEDLVPLLRESLAAGKTRVVLDNTYPTRVSRYSVIRMAHAHRVPVRCRFLNTPLNEAYQNVVLRILERYGRLLGPDDLKELSKSDPNLPPPAAMARWAASFEPPALDEGFSVVEEIPFIRRSGRKGTVRGLLLDVDGTLRTTRSGEIYPRHPDDVQLLPSRKEVLQQWVEAGYRLFFVSNQSGVASGNVSREAVDACFQRTVDLLALPVAEIAVCPHPAFPAGCFCRKPLPGLGIYLKQRHDLASENLVMVGDMDSDAEFSAALGAKYFSAEEFFSPGAPVAPQVESSRSG
jgi:HAD superfamily hydrolase (TIGR01662 family)